MEDKAGATDMGYRQCKSLVSSTLECSAFQNERIYCRLISLVEGKTVLSCLRNICVMKAECEHEDGCRRHAPNTNNNKKRPRRRHLITWGNIFSDTLWKQRKPSSEVRRDQVVGRASCSDKREKMGVLLSTC